MGFVREAHFGEINQVVGFFADGASPALEQPQLACKEMKTQSSLNADHLVRKPADTSPHLLYAQ